ncbi:MAG: anti-sigma factor family protein [Rubrobacteraceae bacterium]
MSMRRGNENCCCDPEVLFEFVDGALGERRKREVMAHLEECPGCLRHCRREMILTEKLATDGEEFEAPSVCREVAMALPTRPLKVRVLWAALAVAIFVSAGFALSLDGDSPLMAASDMFGAFWSTASSVADVSGMMLAFAGPVIAVALAVGLILDLLVAGVVFSAIRRTRRV